MTKGSERTFKHEKPVGRGLSDAGGMFSNGGTSWVGRILRKILIDSVDRGGLSTDSPDILEGILKLSREKENCHCQIQKVFFKLGAFLAV